MARALLPIALVVGVALAPVCARAESQLSLKSVSVDLPAGGDTGVARVDFSSDGGKSWQQAELGKDEGKYSFRQWQVRFTLPDRGDRALMVRCTNSAGETQPDKPNWNPSGFMRNVIEQTAVVVT